MTTSVPKDNEFEDADELSADFRSAINERYEVIRKAGRGGMATVWLARRRTDGKHFALKVLRQSIAEALGVRRFLREIGIASDVHAPALMPLEESGEIEGVLYYVMPFVEGSSLRARIDAERQMPIADAVRIARVVAEALTALHRHGFVHRDVKPENILLGERDEVFLADYGIARALHAAATELNTSTGLVLGTPAYMSPEQAGGELVDGRSDVYGLGCVLYEMLAGSPPFQGVTAQAIIARHMGDTPPSLRVVRPAVSVHLESVVAKALAKVRADRFNSSEEFIEALDAAISGTNIHATVEHRQYRLYGIAAACLLALLAVIVWKLQTPPPSHSNSVVVFPFASLQPESVGEGDQLAMLMGNALDRTDGAKWLDGFTLMTDADRGRGGLISATRARALARSAHAQYYITGLVERARDSLSVQVDLVDVTTDAQPRRRKESALLGSTTAGALALKAVVRLLPSIAGLERVVDVSSLRSESPIAVSNWLSGERYFRNKQMDSALRRFEDAINEDSLLTPAAFKAAVAASWIDQPDTALALVRLALRHQERLPPRQLAFAKSLERFLSGRANEAMNFLRPALAERNETADAWMLAGEIQYHLLPTVAVDSAAHRAIPPPLTWPYEQFANSAFLKSRELDPEFYPPLAHLAEIAARRGDVSTVQRLSQSLRASSGDRSYILRMNLTERCLRTGAASINWNAEATRDPRTVFRVGGVLRSSTVPQARRCALAAFQSILATQPTQGEEYWNSLMNLHGMFVAQGQIEHALAIVDTAMVNGLGSAVGLFVLDAAVGINTGTRTTAFLTQLTNSMGQRGPASLWLLSLSASHTQDTVSLTHIHQLLNQRRAKSNAQRLDTLMTQVTAAYLALARRDTAGALALFQLLEPTAPHREVENGLWESLAPERLLYCKLLLARNRAAEAHRVASGFDQPQVIVHQLFLRASLDIRVTAAKLLNDKSSEKEALRRISNLESTRSP